MIAAMIIAVDEVIPYGREAFGSVGEVRTFSGRKLGAADLGEADALVVRSVTQVNAKLLNGSQVRFVGSATIGTDHLDLEYLKSRGITWRNAAGSNANSVAEYVTAALLVLAQKQSWNLREKSIAIIGAGHVGQALERKTKALGMSVALCDPLLREATGDPRYRFLDDVLDADILSMHVPLTSGGRYPTRHMINREVLDRLSKRHFLINSARGSVIRESDLKWALGEGKIGGAVLDVWESEPEIDYQLLRAVAIATPHIAGFSLDGKVRGTEMILEALCDDSARPVSWDSRSIYPPVVRLHPESGNRGQQAMRSIVLQAYDVMKDDADLRALQDLPAKEAALAFDRLRNRYPLRPEFHHFIVELPQGETGLAGTLEGLGFGISFVTAGNDV
jgi:erythronate-4-phosphate dehydrogenase